MRNFILGVCFGITVMMALCELAHAQLPTRTMPDTRGIDYVYLSPAVGKQMEGLLAPETEKAGCLYGGVTSHSLTIDSMAPAKIAEEDSVHVAFACDQSPKYVGIVHTHVTGLCEHSQQDGMILMDDDRVLISYILCIYGGGTFKLKDGRTFWFRWKD